MGSGKGKSRRAKASAGTADHVAYNTSKWRKFTNSEGLWGMRVYDYYLGEGNDRYPTKEEHEKVMGELFRDAVDVGAFTLPSPYKAEDFVFQILMDGDRTQEQEVRINVKDNPSIGAVFHHQETWPGHAQADHPQVLLSNCTSASASTST